MCSPRCFKYGSRSSYSRWPNLAAALVDHGYRADEAAKVLGGNAQRVFQKVAAAASTRTTL